MLANLLRQRRGLGEGMVILLERAAPEGQMISCISSPGTESVPKPE